MYDKGIGMYYLIACILTQIMVCSCLWILIRGDEDDQVTMNGYTYGDNNPVMKSGSDGHLAWWIASGAVGGIANVGSYVIGHYTKHKTLKGMNYKDWVRISFGGSRWYYRRIGGSCC